MNDQGAHEMKQADMSVNSDNETAEPSSDTKAQVDTELRQILCDVLGLDADEVAEFDEDTGLFGHVPELDSMAVAGLLTEIEDRIDIMIEDEDVDGEMLETYGGLLDFTVSKAEEA